MQKNLDSIVDLAKRVQVELGPKRMEGGYRILLTKYINEQLKFNVKKDYDVEEIFEGVLLGTRKIDMMITTPEGKIIVELKHLEGNLMQHHEDQLLFYYENLKKNIQDEVKGALLIKFHKVQGFPLQDDHFEPEELLNHFVAMETLL